MNSHWIQKSLEYHGLPLKSIWDGERGEQDLTNLGLTNNIDYTTYRNRCKNLGLAERRVRHRLHQFIAKNAPALFDQRLVDPVSSTTDNSQGAKKDLPVIDNAPPYECFLEGQSHPRVERIFNVSEPKTKAITSMIVTSFASSDPTTRGLNILQIRNPEAHLHYRSPQLLHQGPSIEDLLPSGRISRPTPKSHLSRGGRGRQAL